MGERNVASAVSYYTAMAKKDIAGMGRHLHPKVHLISPMEKLSSKKAVLEAAGKLSKILEGIEVHTKFGSGNQAVLTYDMLFPKPIGVCRAAAVMTFKDGLIVRNELFFDTQPFHTKKK
ncbi:MAG TPA: nuclear transport factor 2 family protein [Candidatus Acidoferrales bacterium]|nr:nuclear transport factor 2 family protein [Candidatus Acidoferrales bacterium]